MVMPENGNNWLGLKQYSVNFNDFGVNGSTPKNDDMVKDFDNFDFIIFFLGTRFG